jgi:predicted metal-dependent HD superfamily phosphohydrolase
MPRAHPIAARWPRLIQRLVGDANHSTTKALADLEAAYADPPRAYHNLNHIAECLDLLDQIPADHDPSIELAIWYHDAIYDPFSKSNEQDAADFMRRAATDLGVAADVIESAARLILITANHHQASAPDEQIIADIDLSILASPAPAYDRYARAIREEYKEVDEPTYRLARKAFLRSLLDPPSIFHTPWAHTRKYDQRAKANITQELATLTP